MINECHSLVTMLQSPGDANGPYLLLLDKYDLTCALYTQLFYGPVGFCPGQIG